MEGENNDKSKLLAAEILSDFDYKRLKSLKWAEFVDSWRLVPRLLVAGYAWLTWSTVTWYMDIKATSEICKIIDKQMVCGFIEASGPTTQQASLVATVIGAAAIVFGMYTNSGKDWSKPITAWIQKN